jgi:hypothetical protein
MSNFCTESGGDILKRRLLILIIVIALLAGFGALLHSPPSLIDVITGATPKSKKTETVKPEGTYSVGFNTQNIAFFMTGSTEME